MDISLKDEFPMLIRGNLLQQAVGNQLSIPNGENSVLYHDFGGTLETLEIPW